MTSSRFLRSCLPAAAAAALLITGLTAPAQTPAQTTPPTAPAAAPAPGPTAATGIGAVSLPVTVVDEKGNAVKKLTAADLKLTDNSTPQTIQAFAPASPEPVTLGILGQSSAGQKLELGDERLGSVHFVDHLLPGTQDNVFVIQYATEVDLLADPTPTASKLHDAINQIGSPQFGAKNGSDDSGSSGDTSDQRQDGGTLYDAIFLAANEELKKAPGQHIIVLVSDGIDHGSQETMSDAIEAAQNARASIFAIYYRSEEAPKPPSQNNGTHHGGTGGGFPGGGTGGGYPGSGGGGGGGGHRTDDHPSAQASDEGKSNLEHLCTATGGYMVEGKRDKADEAYNKLLDLLHNQYTLTFIPTKDAQDSDFQRLTLTTLKKDVYPLIQQGLAPAPQ